MTSYGEKNTLFKKEVICNTKEQGGLEILDNTLNDTFKIKWLIDFFEK